MAIKFARLSVERGRVSPTLSGDVKSQESPEKMPQDAPADFFFVLLLKRYI